jgi:hypothetical protein
LGANAPGFRFAAARADSKRKSFLAKVAKIAKKSELSASLHEVGRA